MIAAVFLALMAIALRDRAFQASPADSTAAGATSAPSVSPPAPQPVEAPAVVAAPPPKPRVESARRDTPAAQPPRAVDTAGAVARAPDSASGANGTLPEVAAVMDSAALLAAGLERKWTADWSNMHRAPLNGSPVVRVLPPGTEVHVAENKWGWWAILWKGDTVGYIAGALLRSTRPYRAR